MKKICLLVLSAFLMAAFAGPHYAKQKEEDYSIAYINDYDGDCELKRKGQSTGEAILDIFIPLYRGDTVITGAGSKLEIVFDDAT
ncbi:MAG TPA: hypothetical protein P5511_10620, partial [Candidatus Goldiibacteriota bacterium]|nr:hypothetical protein [Candidatus Goldiibacteriota bacterium]